MGGEALKDAIEEKLHPSGDELSLQSQVEKGLRGEVRGPLKSLQTHNINTARHWVNTSPQLGQCAAHILCRRASSLTPMFKDVSSSSILCYSDFVHFLLAAIFTLPRFFEM